MDETAAPGWSGDMLASPEMVQAFSAQLRDVINAQAEFVARVRRDAEAMWKANPPEGYSSFEAWWRHRQTVSPFAEIQRHLEKAGELTFALEAGYRRNRHEVPAAKQAAALEKKRAKEAAAIAAAAPGPRPVPAPAPRPAAAPAAGRSTSGAAFLDLVHGTGEERSA
ncbi:hypothetical protein [Kitasatospora sp. A2-31]|uniref:hypothetical protein n=1 Tax=Kitasatospora sp. A2-31 TaxID=2916414 RepID=UPI001EEB3DF6|nr:hypothetical protein [Kitasatospora sp. A2-31]MCG6496640.1 hypothetical protein [Kitasatospora sp. A2-31]